MILPPPRCRLDTQLFPHLHIPNFQFPHSNLPSSWASIRIPRRLNNNLPRPSSFDQAVLARDVSCRISKNILGTESAHLIPRTEDRWFNINQMLRYSSHPEAPVANSVDNKVLLLQSDLHHLFDQGRFVLLPKRGDWVIHVLSGLPNEELAALYHNVALQPLSELSAEFLFARFAWTVLAQSIFLRADTERRLVIIEGDESNIEDVSGLDCRTKLIPAPLGAKSRSQSPKKRAQGTGSENQEEENMDTESDDEDVWDDKSI